MYYKSATVLHYLLGHTFQDLQVILHGHAKLIDKFITATFEIGVISIITSFIGVFTLMLEAGHSMSHALDSAMIQWMPMIFESFSRCF